MIRAVVLHNQSGDWVEQVGGAEQPAGAVRHGTVDEGHGQLGVKDPDQSEPGLVG